MRVEDVRDSFFQEFVELAEIEESLMVLSADHGAQALDEFQARNPTRVLNVGIAEQNMISMAAGLAAAGKLPIAYGINPFVSLRALEQITLDVAANNLPVAIASIGSGFAYSVDGASHHGLQDSNVMMGVPGLEVLNASDPESTKFFARKIVESPRPRYLRLEKGVFSDLPRLNSDWRENGIAEIVRGAPGAVVFATGSICHEILRVIRELELSGDRVPTFFEVLRLNPLPSEQISHALRTAREVLVVEESYPALGTKIGALIAQATPYVSMKLLAVPERFFFAGAGREEMRRLAGLSRNRVAEMISSLAEDGLS